MYVCRSAACKVPVVLSRFFMKIFNSFSKNAQISNFMKIRSVGVELFRADRRMDGRIDMTKIVVAFRNFAKEPKQYVSNNSSGAFTLLTIARHWLSSRGTCINRPTSRTVFLRSRACDSSVNIGQCLTDWKRGESIPIRASRPTFPGVKRPGRKTEQT